MRNKDYRDYVGFYGDNGKENGNYYIGVIYAPLVPEHRLCLTISGARWAVANLALLQDRHAQSQATRHGSAWEYHCLLATAFYPAGCVHHNDQPKSGLHASSTGCPQPQAPFSMAQGFMGCRCLSSSEGSLLGRGFVVSLSCQRTHTTHVHVNRTVLERIRRDDNFSMVCSQTSYLCKLRGSNNVKRVWGLL